MTVSKLVIELLKFADKLVDDRTTEGVFFEYDFENSGYSTDKLTAAGETLAEKLTDVLCPEWAEVSVSNLIEENRQLKAAINGARDLIETYFNQRNAARRKVSALEAQIADHDRDDQIGVALWEGVVRELTEQRDSARSIAARLEAELAIAEQAAEVTSEVVVDMSTTGRERCPDWTRFAMSTIWCEREPHPDGTAHRWGDLTWPA